MYRYDKNKYKLKTMINKLRVKIYLKTYKNCNFHKRSLVTAYMCSLQSLLKLEGIIKYFCKKTFSEPR